MTNLDCFSECVFQDTQNYQFVNIKKFPVHRSILTKPKSLFEQTIIRNRGFNIDNVIQIEGKFILLNDGSIYFDKVKISKLKYVTIKCIPETTFNKHICLGLSIDGFIYIVTDDEKKIRSLENIVHFNCSNNLLSNINCKTLPVKIINKNGDLIGVNIVIDNF